MGLCDTKLPGTDIPIQRTREATRALAKGAFSVLSCRFEGHQAETRSITPTFQLPLLAAGGDG